MTNPARSCIFNKQFVKFFDKNPNQIRPLGFRASGDLSDIGFVQKDIQLSSLSSAPPWLLSSPSVDFSLTALSKSDTSPEIFQSKFLEVCEGLQDHYHLYTDGSRMNSLVGAAAVGRDVSKILRITDKASIFTAELVALNLALDIIRRSKWKKFVIFSDSLSSLMAIHNRHLETGYVQKVNQLPVNSGKTITVCCIPSHVGIRGN